MPDTALAPMKIKAPEHIEVFAITEAAGTDIEIVTELELEHPLTPVSVTV